MCFHEECEHLCFCSPCLSLLEGMQTPYKNPYKNMYYMLCLRYDGSVATTNRLNTNVPLKNPPPGLYGILI